MSNRKWKLVLDVSYIKYITYMGGGSGCEGGSEYEMEFTSEYNNSSETIINKTIFKIMASTRPYLTYYIFSYLPRWNSIANKLGCFLIPCVTRIGFACQALRWVFPSFLQILLYDLAVSFYTYIHLYGWIHWIYCYFHAVWITKSYFTKLQKKIIAMPLILPERQLVLMYLFSLGQY